VLRPISGSRRLESMHRRLFTMMLHEVVKRAISSTQRLHEPVEGGGQCELLIDRGGCA
jgi:hypothetical protein